MLRSPSIAPISPLHLPLQIPRLRGMPQVPAKRPSIQHAGDKPMLSLKLVTRERQRQRSCSAEIEPLLLNLVLARDDRHKTIQHDQACSSSRITNNQQRQRRRRPRTGGHQPKANPSCRNPYSSGGESHSLLWSRRVVGVTHGTRTQIERIILSSKTLRKSGDLNRGRWLWREVLVLRRRFRCKSRD